MRTSVVLLSGGLDSAVAMAKVLKRGDEVLPMAIDYGQRHRLELSAAMAIAKFYGLACPVFTVAFPRWGSLVGDDALPENRTSAEISGEVSSTYVPCRNTVFLALAASYAEGRGADSVVTGFNLQDAGGYPSPDGRPEFLMAMELALFLGSKRGVEGRPLKLEAPLIMYGKREVVDLAFGLGVPVHVTRSCFANTRKPCRKCDACVIREEAFRMAGRVDNSL